METLSKLGFTFHRTFTLSRDLLRQVVNVAIVVQDLSDSVLYRETGLGKEQVSAFRRYAIASGLLQPHQTPSAFGMYTYDKDPGLSSPESQWLIHYHMVAPHRCNPLYWSHLVTSQFLPGNELTRSSIVQTLDSFMQAQAEIGPKKDALESTSNVFLGSYAKPDGLTGIGVFASIKDWPSKAPLIVQEVEPPSISAFAYILADYWDGVWFNRKDVAVREITTELGPLLMLDSGVINAYLNELHGKGLVEVNRKIPPYHVKRLWENSEPLLRQIYA